MGKFSDWLDRLFKGAGDKLQESHPTQPKSVEQTQVQESAPVEEQKPKVSDAEKPKEKPQTESKPQLESLNDLLRSIISTLRKIVEDKDSTKGMSIILWLDTEPLAFKNYANDQYRQRVLTALVNEHGYYFEEVSISLGKPAEELHAIPIGDNKLEYLQVLEKVETPKTISCKATISIFGEAGSLLQEQYTLSSDEMREKMISAYNIGAGKFPKIPTGYRENHIAIDDNPLSPFVEKNKYVSRTHAHIGFSDTFGFYLQVEKDGTRLMGKRTRIFRNGQDKPIECDNPQAKVPLENGDLIELGKAVVLRYILLDSK